AHFYLGTALTELARYPEAAHVLERAVEIIRDDEVLGSSRGNLNDVWNAMATARQAGPQGACMHRVLCLMLHHTVLS
ncbi:unnamed protein product, partial [Closterium sp. NIES-54]